ncbi:hypothetical protein N8273_00350 [Algibacter sp.]|nr:hypothetical protein [Algibacter sp.]
MRSSSLENFQIELETIALEYNEKKTLLTFEATAIDYKNLLKNNLKYYKTDIIKFLSKYKEVEKFNPDKILT